MTNKELLEAWNNNEPIKVCSMGGFGEGYERAIYIIAMTILNELEKNPYDYDEVPVDEEKWKKYMREVDNTKAVRKSFNDVGASGAQVGAAWNIATVFNRNGYEKGYDMIPEDRRIVMTKYA